MTYIDLILC